MALNDDEWTREEVAAMRKTGLLTPALVQRVFSANRIRDLEPPVGYNDQPVTCESDPNAEPYVDWKGRAAFWQKQFDDKSAVCARLFNENATLSVDRDAWSAKCAELVTELGRLRGLHEMTTAAGEFRPHGRVFSIGESKETKPDPFRDFVGDRRRIGG